MAARKFVTTLHVTAGGLVASAANDTIAAGDLPSLSGTYQPLDGDLTALAALSGTHTIYYRSAADTWSAVTIGSGLDFTGATLSATGSGGTVTSVTLTQPAAGLTITGSGVAITGTGTPTFALADDLAALEALSGTHTIYYRSAASTWSAVTIGTGLDFTGATLSCTVTGGGTYTADEITIHLSGTNEFGVIAGVYQPADATLTALAAFNTNGLLTQTAADTFTGRTITGVANRTTITNGSGVAGNPTVDISSAYVGQSSITTTGTLTGGATGAGFTVALGTSTVTGILGSANGGTANGFTKFAGPVTSEKTFTLPNASSTIVTYETAGTFSTAQTFINSSGIKINDTDASNTLGLVVGSNLTGNRTLTIAPGDANRTITLSGDTTLSGTNTGDQTTVSGNSGTATALATARAIYGNNFDGTAALSQIITSVYGGTGNGFAKFAGPATSEKTFTLPNASDTVGCLGQAQSWSAAQTFVNSSGIKIQDTDASHTLGIVGGSNLTAARTLTLTTGDASRVITLTGDPTLVAGTMVPDSRTVSAGGIATGGGDLSANRTITVTAAVQSDQEAGTSTTVVTSPGVQHYHPSASKAWVHFTVSGSTVTIVASYNVSSVTRTAAGDYTVNFTTAFSSGNAYTFAATGALNTAGNAILTMSPSNTTAPAAGSFRLSITTSAGVFDDPKRMGLIFMGDF